MDDAVEIENLNPFLVIVQRLSGKEQGQFLAFLLEVDFMWDQDRNWHLPVIGGRKVAQSLKDSCLDILVFPKADFPKGLVHILAADFFVLCYLAVDAEYDTQGGTVIGNLSRGFHWETVDFLQNLFIQLLLFIVDWVFLLISEHSFQVLSEGVLVTWINFCLGPLHPGFKAPRFFGEVL